MSMLHRVDDFWLPDDTEEDLVGADWHQYAIVVLYNGMRDVADLDHLPWHVGNQLTMVGWSPQGVWRPSPDIAVYPTAGSALRKEMSVKEDGPPTLVVEVASPSTWAYDVNEVSGKAAGYLGVGVEYYLVFDPTSELLGVPGRGWRQAAGITRDWRPEADGSYRCASLGIALRPEGIILRVLDRAGRSIPTREERLAQLTAQAARLTAQAARLAAQEKANAAQVDEISALREEIARLRAERQDPA
jgi:Uma2 family endonuclease